MLCIKTKVLPSSIHGLGLFADESISKGDLIWKFLPGFDQRFTHEQVANFPEIVQKYLVRHASYRKSGLYLLCADEGNYFNHSDNPNVHSLEREGEEEMPVYAFRDIQPGEELTENYNEYDRVDDKNNLLQQFIARFHLEDAL
jgi:SET domain-containing protein